MIDTINFNIDFLFSMTNFAQCFTIDPNKRDIIGCTICFGSFVDRYLN
jgi:hypothetical protein